MNSSKEYRVGQVLYMIAQEGVVPLLVKEEITKVTLSGTVKSYVFLYQQKDIDSSTVKNALFESLDDVEVFLLEKAKVNIHKYIVSAKNTSMSWYKLEENVFAQSNIKQAKFDEMNFADPSSIEENEEVLVTLPDGTVAKYKPKKIE
jgi:hypothetical protein